jgi:hypothetical protein
MPRPEIEAIFTMEGEQFAGTVLANARLLASLAKDLTEEQRARLLEVLDAAWPEEGFGASFTRTEGQIHSSNGGAFAWLFLGPALDAPLAPEQWADAATSGVVMTDTADWLRGQYTEEGALLAAENCDAAEARNWAQLVESIPSTIRLPDTVVTAVAEHLRVTTEPEERDFELWHIGQRFAAEGHLDALQELSSRDESIARRLLPWRAAAGETDAAHTLLESMIDTTLQSGRNVDRTDAEWLEGVRAPELLPLLFAALEAELKVKRDDPFGVRGDLERTIHQIGGEDAIRMYDDLIEGSDDSRFKFLRIPRDALVQSELRAAGQERAAAVADELGVPTLAPLTDL